MLTVGSLAPDFTLSDHAGVTHTLSQYRGKRVVLYFYPKDDTPGCTAQACGFRDNLPHFSGLDAVILGVSADSQRSHAKFVGKFKLNFPLLADTPVDGTPSMINAYGAWVRKSMFGKPYMAVDRTTYLIDAQGRIERIWHKVNPDYHTKEVLLAIRGLPSQEIEAKTPPMFIIEEEPPKAVTRRKVAKRKQKKKSASKQKPGPRPRPKKPAKSRTTNVKKKAVRKSPKPPMKKPRKNRGENPT